MAIMIERQKNESRPMRPWLPAALAALLTACGGYGGGGGGSSYTPPPTTTPPPTPSAFSMSGLVSDGSVASTATDHDLINPWGIVFAPNAPVWIADNATESSTLYDGTGLKQSLKVTLPGGVNGSPDATGIVFNGSTTDFTVTNGTVTAPARFIFDGEGGTIIGWAPTVDLNNGIIAYDDGNGGAVYKGLAIAADGSANFLYATDFHNNKVDVFDKDFHKVAVAGGFTDSTLPTGYAPFGIQALQISGQTVIVVTYAQRATGSNDNVNGAGLGLVNTFDTKGTLLKHLVPVGGQLNAPWGVALAPAAWGTLSNDLLIGNFGDGVINAYNPDTGAFVDSVKNSAGQVIANPGLWGIAFGNGAHNQPTTTLYFSAGIADEAAGLYGRIDLGATAPDIVAPTVTLSAPADGSTVSGSVPLTVTAADNTGIASVQYFAGTTSIGTATTAPFSFNWDSTTVANGSVAITAQAKDAAGNSTTSAAVTVTVSNAPPPTVTLAQLQTDIFTPKCSSCHTGGGAALPSSMNLSSAAATFASLVNVTSVENVALKRVTAGDPASSYIINKLEGTNLGGTARMPLGGPFLDQPTIDRVKTWITAGAQNN